MAAGRPRSFDLDTALDRATEVFWKKGFEGASLPELTAAMGINRPSLYAAFGNKEALFRRAMDRYAQGPAAHVERALAEPTARRVAERLLEGTVQLLSNPRHPRGCLLVQSALACGTEAESVRDTLAAKRAAGEARLRQRLEKARAAGDLPKTARPSDLARYLMTVAQGLSVQAAGGATRKQLRDVARLALAAWPS